MAGPQDPAAAGSDRRRAGHADREQVIETLKAAFAQGRLTKDELDTRAGQALAAQTYADLAALTADIPPALAAPPAARTERPAQRRPLARAGAWSGGCLVIAAAALWGASILDPGPNVPGRGGDGAGLVVFIAIFAALMALGILANGAVTSWEQRRSRRQLPPPPGPGGHTPQGEPYCGAGHDQVPPGPRTDQARADLRSDSPRPRRPHFSRRGARTPRGIRPVPDGG